MKTLLISYQQLHVWMDWAYNEGKNGVSELTYRRRKQQKIEESK